MLHIAEHISVYSERGVRMPTLHLQRELTARGRQLFPHGHNIHGQLTLEGYGDEEHLVWTSEEDRLTPQLNRVSVNAGRLERPVTSLYNLQVGKHELQLHRNALPVKAEIQERDSEYLLIIPLYLRRVLPAQEVRRLLMERGQRLLLAKHD